MSVVTKMELELETAGELKVLLPWLRDQVQSCTYLGSFHKFLGSSPRFATDLTYQSQDYQLYKASETMK